MKLLIINGPNLNLLGSREPKIYGNEKFEVFMENLQTKFGEVVDLEYFQSNVEGELINRLHEAANGFDGVILNAAAYTHTSIGIGDAVAAIDIPVVEVHISNTHSREEFRHKSFISKHAKGVILGFGLQSYELGVISFLNT